MYRMFRRLPRSLRRWIVFWPVLLVLFFLVRARRPRPGPLVVAGLLTSPTGLGEGARLCLEAAQVLGVAVQGLDFCNHFTWHRKLAPIPVDVAPPGGGTLLVHINPSELPYVLLAAGWRQWKHRHIVGYWAWELPRVPREWLIACHLVDEVWVPSRFVAEAFGPEPPRPVRVITHPVKPPAPSSLSRRDFALSDDAFVCLTMFDMRSSMDRKNPLAALQAFVLAFGDDVDAQLAIKVSAPESAPQQLSELKAAVAKHRNIMLIIQTYADNDVAALIKAADVVVSLHRSEGLGLVLAKAMLLGKPVVATAYSGNMDFMNAENSALVDYKLVPIVDQQRIYTMSDQQWAEPNITHAAEWLRRLKDNEDLRRQFGAAAVRDAKEFFSIERYHKAISATSLFDWLAGGLSETVRERP